LGVKKEFSSYLLSCKVSNEVLEIHVM